MADAELLVRGRGLARSFGTGEAAVAAVRAASFEIRSGDCIALVGPSGSGKTTLLHLVAGLDEPTEGSIEWPGLGPASSLRPGPVAFAFQGPSLLPPLTVQENVALPLLLLGHPYDEGATIADRLLERFDLRGVGSKLPEELSGGQSQRAGLARALAGSPRLVLADEPTGQQDRVTSELVMNALLDAADDSGFTLVVATHDPAVAARLDARWEMRDGLLLTGVPTSTP